MGLREPLDSCFDCNSIPKSSHGFCFCCDKHMNTREKDSICPQNLTTATVGKLCEGVREGNLRNISGWWWMSALHLSGWPGTPCAAGTYCAPRYEVPQAGRLAARAVLKHHPWRSCGACSGHANTPRGTWTKSGQTFTWETCKREGSVEGFNATLSAHLISSKIFHSLFKKRARHEFGDPS